MAKPRILFLSALSVSFLSFIQVIPPSLDRFFDDFPFIAVVVFLWLMSDKRLERILDVHMVFFKSILNMLDSRQNQISDRIELLTQQVAMNTHQGAMNTAATNEMLKKDDIFEQLLDHMADDRRGGNR